MKDKQAKYPQLRFKGFTDPWVQRSFKTLYKKVIEKNDLSFESDRIISVANMYYKPNDSKSDEKYMETYNIFRLGDIAFEGHKSKNFAYGRFVENTIGDGIVSHVFDVFRPISEYDLNYWKYFIHYEDIMGQKLRMSTTKATMMNNLVSKDFLKQSVLVPNLDEQQKIGTFFKQLDHLITLHQRKLAKLKELKQGYLQKLFPENGSKFPQLRFAGFADAWEKRKLGDFIKIKSGKAWKSSEYTKFGNFLVVTIANVQGNYFINDQVGNHVHTNDRDQFILSFRDILISLTGNVGRVSRMTEAKAVLNQRVGKVIIISKKIDNEFLFQTMNCSKFEKQMILRGQGAAQLNITNKDVIDYRLTLPTTIDEQVSIGHILHLLDNLIAATQHKVDLLKKLKQGYLQKMFC